MVPFKYCFMQCPEIPNFYLVNLEAHPFFEEFVGPVGPQGCVLSKSWIKPNVHRILFKGVSSKNYPNYDVWFSPLPGPWGTRGALGVPQIKKWHKSKSDRQNSKILVAPLASPAFWPRFLGPWAKNQYSSPNILFASLYWFQKGVTQPPPLPQKAGRR